MTPLRALLAAARTASLEKRLRRLLPAVPLAGLLLAVLTPMAAQGQGNHPATFNEGSSTTRSVEENTPPGEYIGALVKATDPDGESLRYALSGSDAALFAINSDDGQLRTKGALDYETRSTYVVTVRASDRRGSDGSPDTGFDAEIKVTINVTDVDEAFFVSFSAVIPQAGTALTATLHGTGATGTTWQWARSRASDEGLRTWTTISGETSATYTPTGADWDKYLRARASFNVEGGTAKTAEAVTASEVPFGIHANNWPVFDEGADTIRSIAENTAPGTTVGTPVLATDPDDDTLAYSLGGDDASFFAIDESGQLRTAATVMLDYETRSAYLVEVHVRDGKNINGDAISLDDDDAITVSIVVTNEDEAGRVILSSSSPQVDSNAVTATLTDVDGVTGTIIWQWESSTTSGGAFTAIVGATSASYSPVVADVGSYLQATASYTDAEGSGKSATSPTTNAVLAAEVTNSPPAFDHDAATASLEVAENTAASQNIGDTAFAATDPDGDVLTYSLGGVDAASFGIVETSGQLQTKAALDYESKISYSVEIHVTDGSDADGNPDDPPAIDASLPVTIRVTDVAEKPEAPAAPTLASVVEDEPAGELGGGGQCRAALDHRLRSAHLQGQHGLRRGRGVGGQPTQRDGSEQDDQLSGRAYHLSGTGSGAKHRWRKRLVGQWKRDNPQQLPAGDWRGCLGDP